MVLAPPKIVSRDSCQLVAIRQRILGKAPELLAPEGDRRQATREVVAIAPTAEFRNNLRRFNFQLLNPTFVTSAMIMQTSFGLILEEMTASNPTDKWIRYREMQQNVAIPAQFHRFFK